MKKKILALVCVVALLLTLFALSGCDEITTTAEENKTAETLKSSGKVSEQYTIPQLGRSLDYENVIRRLEYLNQGNTVGYLYCMSDMGTVIKEVQVAGKVTSLNTFVSPNYKQEKVTGTNGNITIETELPDVDGTYGNNIDGCFWFTPDGKYGEWNGKCYFSSERIDIIDGKLNVRIAE